MSTVLIGNPQAIDHRTRAAVAGQQITTFRIDDSVPLDNVVVSLTHADGAFSAHSVAPAPAWVESDNAELAERLAAHWGCPVGRTEDWEPAEQEGPAPILTVADPMTPVVVSLPGSTLHA